MVALMFFAATGTTMLQAAEAAGRAATIKRTYGSAEVFDRNGTRTLYVEGPNIGANALPIVRELRRNQEFLAQWRAVVLRYAKHSKRGRASVAVSLVLLDALEAPTDAEYHRLLKTLPVDIVKRSAIGDAGQPGIETIFRVNGVVRTRLFRPATDMPVSQFPAIDDNEADASPSDDMSLNIPAQGIVDDCEYEGQPDVCATEEEIDEAVAIALAAQDEMTALEEEVEAGIMDLEDWCSYNPCEIHDDTPVESDFAEATPVDLLGEAGFVSGDPVPDACSAEKTNVRAGFWGTFGVIATVIVALVLAPPTLGASLTIVIAGTATIGGLMFATAAAAETLQQCINRNKPPQ